MAKTHQNPSQNHGEKRKPEEVTEGNRRPLDRFKAARELEYDDDPEAFEKRVAEIAKAKPKGDR
jgi:hypothetical protein